jgi:hypothetical protein
MQYHTYRSNEELDQKRDRVKASLEDAFGIEISYQKLYQYLIDVYLKKEKENGE